MGAEMTRELSAAASDKQRSDDSFEIVLELDQTGVDLSGSRAERIAQQKSSFESCAQPVKAAVLQAGGSIEGEAWVNCTIRARVPAKALTKLREVDGVKRIDVPHRIKREG